jgi:LEA14-like dessication related protein
MKMFRASFFAVAVIALVSVLLSGCTSRRPEGISVSLVSFRPTDASLLESRGVLTLRYLNENIFPLGYSGSKHKLYLNGKYVGTAVSDQPFGVPPLNTVTQDVTIHLENILLMRQLIEMRDSQTASYRLESVLFQTIDEERFQAKLQAEGTVDLRGVASLAK